MSIASVSGPIKPNEISSLSREVINACADHPTSLVPFVVEAMKLAAREFAPTDGVSAEVDVDPDTNDRRVVINVTASHSPEELVRRYHAYIRIWIQTAPADVREWIRLSYHGA